MTSSDAPVPSAPAEGVLRLLAVSEEPLDVVAVLDALDAPASGAVDLFVGRVRDHDGGRGVHGLHYTAHPDAERLLAEVAAEVAAEFDAQAVAAVHRVGALEIGDLAVVVGVATGHRDAAFAATRALIDRLKQRVPIWKDQHYDDGSHGWVGCS